MRINLLLAMVFSLSLGCALTLPELKSVYDSAESLTNRKVEGIESESELVPLVSAFEAEIAAAKSKAASDREIEFVREAELLLEIYRDGLSVSDQSEEMTIEGQEFEVIRATQETKAVFSKYGVNPKATNGAEFFDDTSAAAIWLAALRQWDKLQSVYRGR